MCSSRIIVAVTQTQWQTANSHSSDIRIKSQQNTTIIWHCRHKICFTDNIYNDYKHQVSSTSPWTWVLPLGMAWHKIVWDKVYLKVSPIQCINVILTVWQCICISGSICPFRRIRVIHRKNVLICSLVQVYLNDISLTLWQSSIKLFCKQTIVLLLPEANKTTLLFIFSPLFSMTLMPQVRGSYDLSIYALNTLLSD